MAVRSVRNQYIGINAHLHSLWQAEGGWPEFHTRHIVHLADALKILLLPLGYTAAIESSLQIRRLDTPEWTAHPQSDVTVYDLNPARTPPAAPMQAGAAGELVLPLTEELLIEPPLAETLYRAIKIYARGDERGQPVAWIEVLSPTNKSGGRDATRYLEKRVDVLETGIVFIEIDYLHESPPTLRALPDYPARQAQLSAIAPHPYHILIVDPRPTIWEGVVRISGFDADSPIPTLNIALNGDDVLRFDFGAPYHKTIEDALYGLEVVDYSEFPTHFDRYSPADQARIAARMVAVMQAAVAGVDLETGPFLVETSTLESALAQLAGLKAAWLERPGG